MVELPAVLCDVICLKKLSITNCHQLSALPNGIGKLVNLEVFRLGSCTDLSELPESIRSFHKLCILDLSNCLCIRHLPKDIGELCNLKELHMKGCLNLSKGLPPSTTNLEQLKLVICDEEGLGFSNHDFWELFLFGKFCWLCQLIIIIFHSLFLFPYISVILNAWKNIYQ